jgi:hypothetical protein
VQDLPRGRLEDSGSVVYCPAICSGTALLETLWWRIEQFVMPVGNQRGGKLIERVRHQTELRALKQAKRVTWKCLAAAAVEYTDWQVFGLWVRAVVDAAGNVPGMVAREMESRTPGLLGLIRPDLDAVVRNDGAPGAKIWQDISQWAEINIFIAAKRAGWLDAIRYFSSMSLRSMKAWSYWESIDKQWHEATPKQFPGYTQWQCEVAAVARLSNPDSTAQQVLDSVQEVSEAEWSQLLSRFTDLMAFSLWLELVLDIEGPTAEIASVELAERYRGFSFSRGTQGSKEVVRALNGWAVKHELAVAGQKQMLAALSFHVSHHPAYPAMRRYALHCHEAWPDDHPRCLPSFVEWREAADVYIEA